MRLWTECFPVAGGLLGTESSLRWPRPTRVGDKIHVEIEITAIVPSKTKIDRGIVSYVTQGCAINIHNQNYGLQKTNLIFERLGDSFVQQFL